MVKITYWSPIDPHVHLRWEEYNSIVPPFAQLAFRDARAVGLRALVEEPNTEPHLMRHIDISSREKWIDALDKGDVEHAMAIAITKDPDQTAEALDIITHMERVVSGKTFFARSTRSNAIEITDPEDQRQSWINIANSRYGAIVREGHYEKESIFTVPFNPARPESHALRQCPEAETVQFEENFRYAYDAGFKGILLVKHTSNPETIRAGWHLNRILSPKFKTMFETTWHHMLMNIEEDYPIHGHGVKMNPPLRPKAMQERLLDLVLAGETHTIGSDHAPHPYDHKMGPPYKSGIPGIAFIPKGIELLREHGLKPKDERRLLFDTSNRVYFKGRLKPKKVTVEYNPSLWEAYGFNPWSRIDGTSKAV